MALADPTVLGTVMIAFPALVLGFVLWQFWRASRTGGLQAGFARLVLSPGRVRRFLALLTVSLGSFIAASTTEAMQVIFPRLYDLFEVTQVTAFALGSVALALFMAGGVEPRPLRLVEQLELEGRAPTLLLAIEKARGEAGSNAPTSMYIAPSLADPSAVLRL